jgi:hypothetical protein
MFFTQKKMEMWKQLAFIWSVKTEYLPLLGDLKIEGSDIVVCRAPESAQRQKNITGK